MSGNADNSSAEAQNPFGYDPVIALAIVSTIIFGIITIAITIQNFYYRTWYFMVMTAVGIAEIVGYSFRCSLAYNVYQDTAYIVMSCCIILAPVGLALADYLLVGKLIRYAGRPFSLVDPRIVEWAFIISDVVSIGIQSGGAALLTSSDPNSVTTGSNILIGGLAFNLVSFTFFTVVTGYLHWRIRQQMRRPDANENVQAMFYALYGSIALLILRSIYRIVEFATGFLGYIATHEVFFHLLDTLPISLAFGLFIFMHPGRWMPKRAVAPAETLPVRQ